MRQKRSLGWVVTCWLGLALGCGRSSLIDTGEDALAGSTSVAGSAGSRSVNAGGKGSAGSGFGGTFSQAGTPSGGFFNGGFASAGFPSGGVANDDCPLAAGDCRRESDRECLESREPCEGALLSARVVAAGEAEVSDIATSSDGRLAITGSYRGKLELGGKALPLTALGPETYLNDAFVAAFDALGNAEWAYAYRRDGHQSGTGVRFAPNGDVVVQGSSGPGPFALRLDQQGKQVWAKQVNCTFCQPGHVSVDNDGNVVLVGSYHTSLDFAGLSLSNPGYGHAGYLLKLDGDGEPLWARNVLPATWYAAHASDMATDDEDNIVVVGSGERDEPTDSGDPDDPAPIPSGAFIQKLSARGDLTFSKDLGASASLGLNAVAVDRKMRIVVAGQFFGKLDNAGESFQSGSNGDDLWLAQYSGEGALAWQHAYSSNDTSATVDSATVDRFGNVLLTGRAPSLSVDQLEPVPGKAQFVLKLRSDGSSVWLRWFAGESQRAALAADYQGNVWLGGFFRGKLQLGMQQTDTLNVYQSFLLELSP